MTDEANVTGGLGNFASWLAMMLESGLLAGRQIC